jgi:hypothetical protein
LTVEPRREEKEEEEMNYQMHFDPYLKASTNATKRCCKRRRRCAPKSGCGRSAEGKLRDLPLSSGEHAVA